MLAQELRHKEIIEILKVKENAKSKSNKSR